MALAQQAQAQAQPQSAGQSMDALFGSQAAAAEASSSGSDSDDSDDEVAKKAAKKKAKRKKEKKKKKKKKGSDSEDDDPYSLGGAADFRMKQFAVSATTAPRCPVLCTFTDPHAAAPLLCACAVTNDDRIAGPRWGPVLQTTRRRHQTTRSRRRRRA